MRTRANAVFAVAGEPGQLTVIDRCSALKLRAGPITDYRDLLTGTAPSERMSRLHLDLLDEGIIVAINCLGYLSHGHGRGRD